ncbi:MAG TPA: hypothetical protein VK655_04880 [Solirubrobacteraceae bacterium]|nr:hypothetical protein [Solirubrobacteraceae bacterium]
MTEQLPTSAHRMRRVALDTAARATRPDESRRRLARAAIAALLGAVALLATAGAQAAVAAPLVTEESTAVVTQTSATLQARVEPNGADTRASFEFGPTTSYGATLPARGIDVGTSPRTVTVQTAGLVPGATYHFRVVATSSEGATESPDFVFTTHSPPSPFVLPDNRAYELVTPVDKTYESGEIRRPYFYETAGSPFESSPNGDAVTYMGEGFYGATSGAEVQQYLSTRSASGWSTTNLSADEPLGSQLEAAPYTGFSAADGIGVISPGIPAPLAPGVPAGYEQAEIYRRNADGSLTALITTTPPDRAPSEFGDAHELKEPGHLAAARFAGGSEDYAHLFFEANDALTPDADDGGVEANNLYEWYEGGLKLVNVLPSGVTQPGASFGYEHHEAIESLRTHGVFIPSLAHAISADGARVFWTDEQTGALYLREDATRTIQVDAAVGGGGEFQDASTDGAKALYTKLGDLYEYDVTTGTTTDLAPGGEVQGVMGTSSDASYVYFVARAILAPGAVAGAANVYVSHAGVTSFITTLPEADNGRLLTQFEEYAEGGESSVGDWAATFAGRLARVSPSVRYLAFPASARLTSFPVPSHDVDVEERMEIYLYDFATGSLRCASCRADGQAPTKPAWLPVWPALSDGFHQPRWLNDNGQVFFYSEEELAPGATSGGLYEYEGDSYHLLAAGSPNEVGFVDASETGSDVFFRTTSELVPADKDQLGDIYDARVGGGFSEPSLSPCVADACHGEPTPAPAAPSLISATVGPSGNLPPATTGPAPAIKPLTRAQKLVTALASCGRLPKRRRTPCVKRARLRYGPIRRSDSRRASR